jgi:hypothetical protein
MIQEYFKIRWSKISRVGILSHELVVHEQWVSEITTHLTVHTYEITTCDKLLHALHSKANYDIQL